MTALAELPLDRQTDVLAALAAVETSDAPVRPQPFRALRDPALRATVEECLTEQGRVLLRVGTGYLSGYDDTIGARLAADGIGVLHPDDRAVLALALLHCVAIPRAEGRITSTSWLDAEPVKRSVLSKSKVPDNRIQASLRRLRDGRILAWGRERSVVPGPQFARLSPQASARLWEDLIVLAQPHGVMADVIRARRADRATQEAP